MFTSDWEAFRFILNQFWKRYQLFLKKFSRLFLLSFMPRMRGEQQQNLHAFVRPRSHLSPPGKVMQTA
jgi:hypothetical protein